jgi:outer membrane protein assembly factor BamA
VLTVALVACALWATPLMAFDAVTDSTSDSTTSKNHSLLDRLSPPQLEWFGFVYLPKVTYGADTGVGVGGHILRPFSVRNGAVASEVDIGGRATVKGQGEAAFTLDLEWGEHYSAKTKVEFTNIAHRFYGIGPDTKDSNEEVYERQSIRYYLELFRGLTAHLRAGVRGEFEASRMLETEPGGLFATRHIPGVVRSQVLGWGFLADWDTRDDRYWPTRGSYHQSFFMMFDDGAQSDFNFDVYYLDLRKYIPTAQNHVLALQGFMYATDGAPPFWRLAELGGRAHSRGYRRGRYRDKSLVAFQAEHRFAVWRRLGLVGFVGLADVAPQITDLKFEHMRLTAGGGVRVRVSSGGRRINARFDAAYGNELRAYFTLGEAF